MKYCCINHGDQSGFQLIVLDQIHLFLQGAVKLPNLCTLNKVMIIYLPATLVGSELGHVHHHTLIYHVCTRYTTVANIGALLDHRLGRRHNITAAFDQCLVSALASLDLVQVAVYTPRGHGSVSSLGPTARDVRCRPMTLWIIQLGGADMRDHTTLAMI